MERTATATHVSFATAESAALLRLGLYQKAIQTLQFTLPLLQTYSTSTAATAVNQVNQDQLRSRINILAQRNVNVDATANANLTNVQVTKMCVDETSDGALLSPSSGTDQERACAFRLFDRSFVVYDDDESGSGLMDPTIINTVTPSNLNGKRRCNCSSEIGYRLAAVVFYDMALCYHLWSLHGGQGNATGSMSASASHQHQEVQHMKKAIKLYLLALLLLQQVQLFHDTDAMIYLGILNNLGHAYEHVHLVHANNYENDRDDDDDEGVSNSAKVSAQACLAAMSRFLHSTDISHIQAAIQDLDHYCYYW